MVWKTTCIDRTNLWLIGRRARAGATSPPFHATRTASWSPFTGEQSSRANPAIGASDSSNSSTCRYPSSTPFRDDFFAGRVRKFSHNWPPPSCRGLVTASPTVGPPAEEINAYIRSKRHEARQRHASRGFYVAAHEARSLGLNVRARAEEISVNANIKRKEVMDVMMDPCVR